MGNSGPQQHQSAFDFMANDDVEATQDKANDLETIIAVLNSAEKEEQEPPRPLPSPESSPLPPRQT